MKKTEGQFILMDTIAFAKWLNNQNMGRTIKRIQNHHTWKPDYTHFKGDNHFNLLKGMRNSHLQRGFSDIAQNITTFPDGTLAVCRPLSKMPAGIKGANRGAICIEHIGNFNLEGDQMAEAHKDTIIRLNALLCSKLKLKPDTESLVYHHWWDLKTGKRKNGEGVTKTCPGTAFFNGNNVEDALKNFIPEVEAHLEEMSAVYI